MWGDSSSVSETRDWAFQETALHVLTGVLYCADSPARMSSRDVEQIRALTGARTVILLQCLRAAEGKGHRVVGVDPQRRRRLAADWARKIDVLPLGIPTRLYVYRNVRTNNANLPPTAWRQYGGALPASADELDPERAVPFVEIFRSNSMFLALTELSATAPLKLAAREFGFRAATMPGLMRQ